MLISFVIFLSEKIACVIATLKFEKKKVHVFVYMYVKKSILVNLIAHFRVPLCLCFKASLSTKYGNDFELLENETACRTHFLMKGFQLGFVLKQRHKRTRKWPIASYVITHAFDCLTICI